MLFARSQRAWLLPTLALSALAACEVGVTPAGGGDDDDVQVDARPIDAPTPTYSLAVAPATAATTLGTDTTFTVSLAAQHFAGPVTLAATGAPASWTVVITPATVDLTDGGSATATVKVTVPSNGDAALTGQALTISGASAIAGPQAGAATLTVTKDYVVAIGAGTGAATHFGPMNNALVRVKAGTRVHIRNIDAAAHRIHSGGGIGGFPHQPNDMAAGQEYAVTVTDGSDVFYCHVHERPAGEVNLVVE